MYIRRLLLSRKGSFSCLSVPMCENEYVNRTSFKHRGVPYCIEKNALDARESSIQGIKWNIEKTFHEFLNETLSWGRGL
jgi:hypothetical protein